MTIRSRIRDAAKITKVQCATGNWDYDSYMHGMANGMILVLATVKGDDPVFLKAPKKWLSDDANEIAPYKETSSEKQSNVSRVEWAEGLISQLPSDHNGRNSWLFNYGVGGEAIGLQSERGLVWDNETKSAKGVED